MYKKILFYALLCWVMPLQATTTGYLLLNSHQWKQLQNKYQNNPQFIKQCQQALDQEPQPITTLDLPRHYTATGINKIGQVDAHRLSHDGYLAYHLALCYRITQNIHYATHTQYILDSWANSLKYIRGEQAIDDINFHLPAFIIASYWVRDVNQWNDAKWKSFLQQIAPLSNAWKNNHNHGDWGILFSSLIGIYLHNNTLLERSEQRWQDIIMTQITPDGALPHEMCRSDTNNYCGGAHKGIKGLAYTHYALLPLSLAGQIFMGQGKPLWNSQAGKRLAKAFDKAAFWTQHPENFPYFVSNHGQLKDVRNGAYFYLLQQHYTSTNAALAIQQGNLKMDGFYLKLLYDHQ